MECCGNTIKDLYGFSCPLKCSTYILQSVKHKSPLKYNVPITVDTRISVVPVLQTPTQDVPLLLITVPM